MKIISNNEGEFVSGFVCEMVKENILNKLVEVGLKSKKGERVRRVMIWLSKLNEVRHWMLKGWVVERIVEKVGERLEKGE